MIIARVTFLNGSTGRVPLVLPMRANQVWTMDFLKDSLASGPKFRTLNPIHEMLLIRKFISPEEPQNA
jgi:hypothetical protein